MSLRTRLRLLVGLALGNRGAWTEAEEHLRAAVRLDPTNAFARERWLFAIRQGGGALQPFMAGEGEYALLWPLLPVLVPAGWALEALSIRAATEHPVMSHTVTAAGRVRLGFTRALLLGCTTALLLAVALRSLPIAIAALAVLWTGLLAVAATGHASPPIIIVGLALVGAVLPETVALALWAAGWPVAPDEPARLICAVTAWVLATFAMGRAQRVFG